MNTAVENHPRPASIIAQPLPDVFDPDDVYEGARSPMLQPVVPSLIPSPSPEPMISVPELGPEKGSHKEKHRPSMGDSVLVHFMANGQHQDVSRQVARESLASPDDGDQSVGGVGVTILRGMDREELVEGKGTPVEEETNKPAEEDGERKTAHEEKDGVDLATLAAKALRRTEQSPPQESGHVNGETPQATSGDPMEDVKPSIPSITVNNTLPRLIPDLSMISEMQISTTGAGALPPIQHLSNPTLPNGTNSVTLPSLSDHLRNIKHLPDKTRDISNYPQSPPPPPTPRFPGHGSPPRSPNDFRALPSPRQNLFYAPHRRPSQVDGTPSSEGLPYPSPVDYNSSSADTPSEQSPPAFGLDRMSIVGITNPQIGGYQCTYAGCTAPPFQTQYLLNSHANVHSQIRPHYCSVKGCTRSEGGKGFKRKNEMIRHGLVHDSPGYVCPFCPDREHKYPRPDNLQRHVRVHHVDKDKDDPLLRDVLAQRPEGPSRGRRRRGTTG